MHSSQKRSFFQFGAVLLILIVIALYGIFANAAAPRLAAGGHITREDAQRGVLISGWQQEGARQWSFSFTADAALDALTLLYLPVNGSSLSGISGVDTVIPLSPAGPGQPFRICVESLHEPRGWLALPESMQRGLALRQTLQLIGLVSFATMFLCILFLYSYKHSRTLFCFLLYLAVLFSWGLLITLSTDPVLPLFQLLLRVYFALMLLAAVLLSAALTNHRPEHSRMPRSRMAVIALYFLLSLSSYGPLRSAALTCGMLNCLHVLLRACRRNVEGAAILLYGTAVTTGLRIWVLLPSMQTVLFQESLFFYLIRCARVYDLPFAAACLWFVCRRFAQQFDRTEQLARELDQRVVERTRALTEQTEARKSMMLNIFHDLRSPLFALNSGLETLESAPAALPSLLPVLQERAAFLRNLTEDLFLAAKLEQQQLMLNEDHVLLDEEARQVCAAVQTEADKKGVALQLSCRDPLPVWGDSMRLRQIIQNLLTNAVHYTPAGGNIRVSCFVQDSQALVRVADSGCGIAPEEQPFIFQRYFHTTTKNKHDSTGLGLTIAQDLARLHHGEITLQSAPGAGSVFTLCLPLLPEEDSAL